MAFLAMVMCQLFYSLAFRSESKSIFSIGIFSNKYLIGAIILGIALQLLVVGIPRNETGISFADAGYERMDECNLPGIGSAPA